MEILATAMSSAMEFRAELPGSDCCEALILVSQAIAGYRALLLQGDAKVFKKYSQMKLQMKHEALEKDRSASQRGEGF